MIHLTFGEEPYSAQFITTDLGRHAQEGSPVDFYVRTEAGTYAGTAFTLESIRVLMERYSTTGEGDYGQYFWAADLVILKDFAEETFRAMIADLVATGEVSRALSRVSDQPAPPHAR